MADDIQVVNGENLTGITCEKGKNSKSRLKKTVVRNQKETFEIFVAHKNKRLSETHAQRGTLKAREARETIE